jgi:hypothetical protein
MNMSTAGTVLERTTERVTRGLRRLEVVRSDGPPDWTRGRISEAEISFAREWLQKAGQVPTLLLRARPTKECIEILSDPSADTSKRSRAIRASAQEQFRKIRVAVEEWGDKQANLTAWNAFIELRSLHVCAVRRPSRNLQKLLTSELFRPDSGLVARVLPNLPLHLPASMALSEDERTKRVQAGRDALQRKVQSLGHGTNDYVDSLGVGSFDREWAHPADARGCVIDTGMDESHCALQQKSLVHAFFDHHGQFKHAPDSVDRGCHGTKIASVICARTTSRRNLGIDDNGNLRIAACPNGQLAVVSVAQGDVFEEIGSLAQLRLAAWTGRSRTAAIRCGADSKQSTFHSNFGTRILQSKPEHSWTMRLSRCSMPP